MMNKEYSIAWLWRRIVEYRSKGDDICEVVEDLDDVRKLGLGFSLVYELKEVNLRSPDTS
jgi:hypothetical protein